MIRFLTLLVGALILAGCAAPTGTPLPTFHDQHTASTIPAAVPPVAEDVAPPARLSIAKLNATSTLPAVGLVDGEIDIPPATEPLQAAWWDGSPRPGAAGPAVILGHVDGQINGRRGQPGVFNKLSTLVPGDSAVVERVDGTSTTFVVYEVQRVPKDQFPADRVYGNTDGPELRLITCGGTFDRAARSYEDNWIVYARASA